MTKMRLKKILAAMLTIGLASCTPSLTKGTIYDRLEAASHNLSLCNDGKYDYNSGCIEKGGIEKILESVYEVHDDYTVCTSEPHCLMYLRNGTGVVSNNLFITAKHVPIGNMIYIKNKTGAYESKVLKKSPNADILIGTAKGKGLEFGSYSELDTGDEAYVFGNNDGKGIKTRRCKIATETSSSNPTKRFMLVGCDIDYGDSGSPVVAFRDGKPELVGIVTLKQEGRDIGLAISIDNAKDMIKDSQNGNR